MQTDPKEAKKRFEGDPEVELFMGEFGKVMSSHFSQLGADQERNKQNNTSKTPQSTLQSEPSINTSSMGILQAEAVEREEGGQEGGGAAQVGLHEEIEQADREARDQRHRGFDGEEGYLLDSRSGI